MIFILIFSLVFDGLVCTYFYSCSHGYSNIQCFFFFSIFKIYSFIVGVCYFFFQHCEFALKSLFAISFGLCFLSGTVIGPKCLFSQTHTLLLKGSHTLELQCSDFFLISSSALPYYIKSIKHRKNYFLTITPACINVQ